VSTKKSSQPERTSIYRGVWWDRGKGKFRAEIVVRGKRYKLGWWRDDRDASHAYDLACERLGVPERRNFGAHPVYDELTLLRARMRECAHCRGVGLLGGEFNLKAGVNSNSKFIRFGKWRECESCGGAGYVILAPSAKSKVA
jgi:Zn-finger nucleic acid-binding protein